MLFVIQKMKGFQFLVLIVGAVLSQPSNYSFTVLPSSSYINVNGSYLTQASPQACYADCLNCQIKTNVCQDCYQPYFQKTSTGTCLLSNNYTLESSTNEIRSGAAFTLAAESWSNYHVVNCSASNNNPSLQTTIMAVQPTAAGLPLVYNRTLSIHNYLLVRFELITSNWKAGSLLNITITGNNGLIIAPQIINYLPNVPTEQLCNPTAVDQRFSVTLQIQDISSTTLSIALQPQGGSVSVATWAVITGLCHPSCSSCSYNVDPTACLACNYFLQKSTNGSCSVCPTGFTLVTGTYSYCQKCPIQYQNCNPNQQVCYYSGINATTSNNCTFNYPNSYYAETQELSTNTFVGSLFTVGGLPNPSLYVPCGSQPLSSYSYVGQAQPYQPITRIFATLPPHLALSLSFNLLIIDLTTSPANAQFEIYIDGALYDVRYQTVTADSNLCGGTPGQAFVTFPPSEFYINNSTEYVNLTIVSNLQWGLRDFRLVYQVCDPSCLLCGPTGCLKCPGYFQINSGVCSGCPLGFGVSYNNNFTSCAQCPDNCLTCNPSPTMVCLNCSEPFFLFEGSCKKRANIADTAAPPPLTGSNGASCTLNPASGPNSTSPSNISLTLTNNLLQSTVSIPQPHYQAIVEFYLVRVGAWSPSDRVDLYLNDLLMFSKNYSTTFGNYICNPNSSDFLSFESVRYTDTNSSLSLSFELVTNGNSTLTYGIGNLRVYPVGCTSCVTYPFTYQIQYSYDQDLFVAVSFSRTYRNTNATLFQQIFALTLNNNPLPYSLLENNSVTYNLKATPPKDTLLANLSLLCLYPELVTTDINDSVNTQQPFFARLLAPTYATSKVIDNTLTSTQLTRFTPVQNPGALDGVRTFFQVVSRAIIYIGFAFFFLGLQTVCTHFMHNLQKIWLHIFLAALTAPALLRYTLSGFREVQNQNIAIHPTVWQQSLPVQLYYDSPSYLFNYYTDINFFRNIYNIGVAFAIFLVYLIAMHFLTKQCISRRMANSNLILRHFKITFHRRPFFYFNSIIFYQYLTLILACFLQFTALSNQTNQGSFSGVTAAAAIVAFVLATAYPIFQLLWLRHKQQTMGRQKSVQYSNRYHEIYFRFIHKNIWQNNEITASERVYNIYRFGQLWWLALVVTVLHYSPQSQLYLVLITQALHMLIILFTDLSRSLFFKITKALELALFVGLEIILLVCQTQNQTLTARSYNTIGSVAIAIIFAIILISFIRSIYNAWLIHREYTYANLALEVKSRVRQGEVMRRDEYFSSENGDDNQHAEVEIAGTERD